MKYTRIYIGSNNATKELELGKIKEIMQTAQAGYTLTQGVGVYRKCIDSASQSYNLIDENTAIIEIMGEYNTGIIPELKAKLKQDSIMVVEQISEVSFL